MPSRLLLQGLPLLFAMACAPHAPPDSNEGDGPLLASIEASTAGDGVTFTLQVTNTSEAPVELTFPSGQDFDFRVERDGRNVWTWSADRMFTQALRTVTMRPGETRTYEAIWRPEPGATGEHVVTGTLATVEPEVRQSTRFRL